MRVLELGQRKLNRPDEKTEERIKKLRKEHDELVKGKFEFIDAQGGTLDFAYRMFKGEPIRIFYFTHGEVTEIPKGVVKHLNNSHKKVRKQNIDLNSGELKSYEVVSRVRFTPMDYL